MPLPTFPIPRELTINPDFTDLTGIKVDRLTVIGLGLNKGGKRRWVVRCACGSYDHRTGTFLRSEAAQSRGLCRRCDYLEEMKAGRHCFGLDKLRERKKSRMVAPQPTENQFTEAFRKAGLTK